MSRFDGDSSDSRTSEAESGSSAKPEYKSSEAIGSRPMRNHQESKAEGQIRI
jgi:hypothetical protein